eukprot:3931183-Prymnesium_polylepis.1
MTSLWPMEAKVTQAMQKTASGASSGRSSHSSCVLLGSVRSHGKSFRYLGFHTWPLAPSGNLARGFAAFFAAALIPPPCGWSLSLTGVWAAVVVVAPA